MRARTSERMGSVSKHVGVKLSEHDWDGAKCITGTPSNWLWKVMKAYKNVFILLSSAFRAPFGCCSLSKRVPIYLCKCPVHTSRDTDSIRGAVKRLLRYWNHCVLLIPLHANLTQRILWNFGIFFNMDALVWWMSCFPVFDFRNFIKYSSAIFLCDFVTFDDRRVRILRQVRATFRGR